MKINCFRLFVEWHIKHKSFHFRVLSKFSQRGCGILVNPACMTKRDELFYCMNGRHM